MQRLGLPPQQSGVHFAQLMGMCDYGTYTLANSGYQVPLAQYLSCVSSWFPLGMRIASLCNVHACQQRLRGTWPRCPTSAGLQTYGFKAGCCRRCSGCCSKVLQSLCLDKLG